MTLPSIFDYLPEEASEQIMKLATVDKGKLKKYLGAALTTAAGGAIGYGAGYGTGKVLDHLTGIKSKVPPKFLGAGTAILGALVAGQSALTAKRQQEVVHGAQQSPQSGPPAGRGGK